MQLQFPLLFAILRLMHVHAHVYPPCARVYILIGSRKAGEGLLCNNLKVESCGAKMSRVKRSVSQSEIVRRGSRVESRDLRGVRGWNLETTVKIEDGVEHRQKKGI